MEIKISKGKYIIKRVVWENVIYVRWNNIKNHIQRWRRLIEEKEVRHCVKPVENISKNMQSFLEILPVQKEVLPSHKLRNHAYEY